MYLGYRSFEKCDKRLTTSESATVLDALLDDDVDALAEVTGNYTDISRVSLEIPNHYKLTNLISLSPTLISAAAFFNAENCFDFLTSLEASVTVCDKNGRSCAHFAAAGGNITIIKNTENFEDKDAYGNTPIFYAVLYGRIDALKFYWSKGVKFEKQRMWCYGSFMPPFFEACKLGDLEIVKFLYDNYNEICDNNVQYRSMTPLCCACQNGNTELVKFLIEKNARIDGKCMDLNHSFMYRIASPLYYAAESGSLATVKILVEAGAEINTDCYNPLNVAACRGHLDIVRYLIEKGAVFIEENGEDPIDQAFRNGQVSVVKFLFNKVNAIKPQKWLNSIVFHDPKTIDRLMKCTDLCTPKYYNTLLSLGLEHLKASTIEYALDNGAKLSRFPKASLKKLFAYRKYDVMKVLIDKYGLLNKDDSRDCPIISYAIEHNDEKMFNLLKEKGALIDKKLIEDHDLVNFAMTNNAFGIAELLLEFNPDLDKSKALDSLYNMSSNYQYRKYIYLIDKLIDRGAQISIGRFIEEFAKKAIDIGSPKLVNIALKNGAKFSSQKTKEIRLGTLNKKHEVSRPCTFDNYDSDHCKCLEILFNSGYDPNTVDSYGENMFHNLMRQDVTSLNAVEFLISNGVDINHQSKDGRTPLILCIEFGMHRLIPKMLELGANPNIADEKGQTPIHYAAQNPNSIFTIITLLEAGADINAKSKLNETAFITIMKKDDLEFGSRKQYYWWYNGLTNQEKMEQRMRGVAEIATFLIESGANIKNYPGGGSVCLGRAKELGNADLIKSVREVFHI